MPFFKKMPHAKSAKSTPTTVLYGIFSSENSFPCTVICTAHQYEIACRREHLCQAYGLNQVGIEGLSTDSEPDASRMDEIIKFAKENNIKTIFFEELVSPKVSETIADEIGAKTAVLNPIEGLTDEEISAGEDYFSVMETNLKTLEDALNE